MRGVPKCHRIYVNTVAVKPQIGDCVSPAGQNYTPCTQSYLSSAVVYCYCEIRNINTVCLIGYFMVMGHLLFRPIHLRLNEY